MKDNGKLVKRGYTETTKDGFSTFFGKVDNPKIIVEASSIIPPKTTIPIVMNVKNTSPTIIPKTTIIFILSFLCSSIMNLIGRVMLIIITSLISAFPSHDFRSHGFNLFAIQDKLFSH